MALQAQGAAGVVHAEEHAEVVRVGLMARGTLDPVGLAPPVHQLHRRQVGPGLETLEAVGRILHPDGVVITQIGAQRSLGERRWRVRPITEGIHGRRTVVTAQAQLARSARLLVLVTIGAIDGEIGVHGECLVGHGVIPEDHTPPIVVGLGIVRNVAGQADAALAPGLTREIVPGPHDPRKGDRPEGAEDAQRHNAHGALHDKLLPNPASPQAAAPARDHDQC